MFTENEPDNFKMLSRLNPFLAEHRGFVAGGVFKNIFTDTKIKDVDIFFESEEDWVSANDLYIGYEYPLAYENDNVRAYYKDDVRVELIRNTFGTPEQVIGNFDFTITKFAYGFKHAPKTPTSTGFDLFDDPYKGKVEVPEPFVLHHKNFFEHLHMKRLVIDDRLVMPVNSWERSYKYRDQGYRLCRESKLILLTEIVKRGAVEDSDLGASLYAGMD